MQGRPMISATADRPPAAHRAVVFCCDAGYLPYALHAAARIAALRRTSADFDICIAGEQPPDIPGALGPLGLRAVAIAAGGLFDGLRLDARRTASAYLRLALPDALGAEYDRILYLDSDIAVRGGDVGALLDVDLRGAPLAAVRDNMQWRTPGRRHEQFRRFGWPAAPYFNSGLLLIDCAAWQAADLTARAVALGRAERERLVGHDQTLLNCVLRGAWAELPPTWNWQYTWATRHFEAMEDPNIVHFIGPAKPWRDPGHRLPPRFAQGLAAFLAGAMPEVTPPAIPPGGARDAAAARRSLFKHWVAAPRMAIYLARFPDDLTVHPPAAP